MLGKYSVLGNDIRKAKCFLILKVIVPTAVNYTQDCAKFTHLRIITVDYLSLLLSKGRENAHIGTSQVSYIGVRQ